MVTVDGFAALRKAAGDSTELVRAAGTVEALREVKDAGEIALLRLACEAADAALTDLVERGGLRAGRTEKEVGRELESLMLDHGADGVSFETIVAAGANSAIPHHRPTDAVLAAGDFVKIDFGALVCGYHSDMTRTFVLAPVAQWQLDIYELVAAAQQAGRDALAPGVTLKDVDGVSRQVIADAGYADNFSHGLGHGVGLQIHEAPGISASAAGTLLAGSAVTVEPGVYLPDHGGVRIEDTLVVREKAEDPTYSPGSRKNWRSSRGERPKVATTADFKNGLVLQIDGQLWQIIEFQHVKPGKGPAFVRTKLKNVLSGKVVDKTYNAGVKVETATVDRRDATYLYRDGSDFVFMDSQDYEQHPLPESLVGDAAKFLLESMPVQIAFHDGAPAVPRAAGDRRTRGHPHRARPAGRPVQRGHQAGHRRDRCRDPGAAVHQHRRQAEGRLPRR